MNFVPTQHSTHVERFVCWFIRVLSDSGRELGTRVIRVLYFSAFWDLIDTGCLRIIRGPNQKGIRAQLQISETRRTEVYDQTVSGGFRSVVFCYAFLRHLLALVTCSKARFALTSL